MNNPAGKPTPGEALSRVTVPCGPQTTTAMKALLDLLTADPDGKL